MEICILKFDSNHGAEEALKEVIDSEGDRTPWLHDVAMVARPLLGRVRIGATYPDGKSKIFREGDLAEASADAGAYSGYFVSLLAGPLGSMVRTLRSGAAGEALGREEEKRLFHLDELKRALPRDSSVLVLLGDTRTCDAMVKLFDSYHPQVVRKQAADELRKRLEDLHQRMAQALVQIEAEGAPATH
jgi:uncharacterized membrane protein